VKYLFHNLTTLTTRIFIISALFSFSIHFLNAQQETGTFIDERDGQEYKWVKIGSQVWMAQNLNVGKILYIRDGEFVDKSIEKFCYKNDEKYCLEYGGLYSWDVMMKYIDLNHVQGFCPSGWHIPTEREWEILINYLGGYEMAGGMLKEAGTAHWKNPNTGATNSGGFTALPAGWGIYTDIDQSFIDSGKSCTFWSSTITWSLLRQEEVLTAFMLTSRKNKVFRDTWFVGFACSVRCVKD